MIRRYEPQRWRVRLRLQPVLLDVIAPSQKVATAVLNFKQVVKDNPVRIHPIASQLVDPAVEKMKVRPVGEADSKEEGA